MLEHLPHSLPAAAAALQSSEKRVALAEAEVRATQEQYRKKAMELQVQLGRGPPASHWNLTVGLLNALTLCAAPTPNTSRPRWTRSVRGAATWAARCDMRDSSSLLAHPPL